MEHRQFSYYVDILDREELVFYLGAGLQPETSVDKLAVMFSHSLALSGAPSALLELTKLMLEDGYTVIVVSEEDGGLRPSYVNLGVSVILYLNMREAVEWLRTIAELSDFILANTLVELDIVALVAPYARNMYWWIHESDYVFEKLNDIMKYAPNIPNVVILSAGRRIKQAIERAFPNREVQVLNLYVEDVGKQTPAVAAADRGLAFLHVGRIDYCKGAEVLADAIDKLRPDILAECDFTFCGDDIGVDEIQKRVDDVVHRYPNVHRIPAMDREQLLVYYDNINAIVVSSHAEATSLIAVEGMMKGIPVICSDQCGVCLYMREDEKKLVFTSGDSKELAERIEYLVSHREEIQALGNLGRKVYERAYSKENMRAALSNIIKRERIINSCKNACIGCAGCMKTCPTSAITMVENVKGFLYPRVDEDMCISCGACRRVCPVNADLSNTDSSDYYAVWALDDERRMQSQSGGAFSVLAERILLTGGVVYGVGMNDSLQAVYMRIESMRELWRLKGSKYVQATVGTAFETAQEDICNGKTVLFAGTPCLIHSLQRYLANEDTTKLITCDLVCHGVVSPLVLRAYLNDIREKGIQPQSMNFRNKKYGWKNQVETVVDNTGTEHESRDYTDVFYTNCALRESCYTCKYASGDRVGDITVGDCWGIEATRPELYSDKGISLVIINTNKGAKLFCEVQKELCVTSIHKEECMQQNLHAPTERPMETDLFWDFFRMHNYTALLRNHVDYRRADMMEDAVKSSWQSALDRGQRLGTALRKRGIEKVVLCGNIQNNYLAEMEFSKEGMKIACILDLFDDYKRDQLWGVRIVNEKAYMNERWDKNETIMITDEVNAVEIMERLVQLGIPASCLLPLSFLVSMEV